MGRTLISIERGAGEPIYQQLRKALEHAIASGALNPRLPLPSSRELARELGVSRNTVNTAYQELHAQGFIESRPRRGLFINPDMLTHLDQHEEHVTTTDFVDWTRRIRPTPDAGMPEIAKIPDWDRYPFPFVAGQIEAESFPRLAWARALRDALDPPHLHYSVRDGIDEDDPLLVQALCRAVLPARGIEVNPDQVLITLGSQQGLDLLAGTLLRPGDTVGVEDPGYLDARHIFARAGATVAPMPVDGSGLIPSPDLADVHLLHLTPSHHSPTNVTLTIGRRQQLLALARRHGTLIIEDDYDSEFRYQGSPTPALKALPDSERVIYLGTFSKFLAPGLRLGYLVAAPELIRELRNQRRYRVRHPSGHVQRAMALLIESGQYHRTVRRRRTQLQRKWQTLREALNETLPWQADPPPGGVSIWVTGPPELDCVELAELALRRGVVIERGDIYFADATAHRNHFRLGFAAIPHSAIRPGIIQLGHAIDQQLR
ncbi:GntR family transcriptional regulator / MocR family aminotransferase [Amycolatopsis marina]|uniref:GntR family transcriptional regulator / MocR family aminotransferase n=1 Tax=Amycolatopsis marina TaxID=490629 RepID=A0A1I0X0I2_9PSEU|nr:PLP-dependent aminotransferase family protein [Amycolatopsis marina]SFA94334.1 GntR family transcriptional regulator / MocR family aminotransferase [Amycolatopsis marina]